MRSSTSSHVQFVDEETEAQRGEVICPRLHRIGISMTPHASRALGPTSGLSHLQVSCCSKSDALPTIVSVCFLMDWPPLCQMPPLCLSLIVPRTPEAYCSGEKKGHVLMELHGPLDGDHPRHCNLQHQDANDSLH